LKKNKRKDPTLPLFIEKIPLGAELRNCGREVVLLIVKANSAVDKGPLLRVNPSFSNANPMFYLKINSEELSIATIGCP